MQDLFYIASKDGYPPRMQFFMILCTRTFNWKRLYIQCIMPGPTFNLFASPENIGKLRNFLHTMDLYSEFLQKELFPKKISPCFFVPTDHKKAIHSSIFVFEEIIPFGPKEKFPQGPGGDIVTCLKCVCISSREISLFCEFFKIQFCGFCEPNIFFACR